MKLKTILDIYFKEYKELENASGVSGRKFRCETRNNSQIFVKAREKEDWDWFEWGLRKEYKICEYLGEKISDIPKAQILSSSNKYVIVGFDYIEHSDVCYRDNYQNLNNIESIVRDLNEIFNWLYRNSDLAPVSITNMKGREQITENRSFQNMKDYLLGERLCTSCTYGNKIYQEYNNEIQSAVDELQKMYSEDRNRLIHGDIQNPENVIFCKNGIKGVVDWEISGWFDYLYDIAFAESIYIDKPSLFSESVDRGNMKKLLYEGLDITDEKESIIKLYKIWPLYLELEYLYDQDSVNGNYNIEEERKKQREHLNQVVTECDL